MPTFRKPERLCSQRRMDRLFAQGERLMVFPFSVRWMLVDDLPLPAQVMIVAPKRKLRHAVDRNHARRLIRECYRLQKQPLYDLLTAERRQLVWSINYVQQTVMPYATLCRKFGKMLAALRRAVQEKAEADSERENGVTACLPNDIQP